MQDDASIGMILELSEGTASKWWWLFWNLWGNGGRKWATGRLWKDTRLQSQKTMDALVTRFLSFSWWRVFKWPHNAAYVYACIHTCMHACIALHCITLHYITYIYVLFLRHFCANAHGEWKAEHTFAICTRGPQNSSWIFVENKNIPPIFMMCNLRVLDLELQKSEGYGSKDFQGT